MIYRTASAPAKPVSLTLAAIARPLATTIAWSLPLAVALADWRRLAGIRAAARGGAARARRGAGTRACCQAETGEEA